MNAIAAIQRKVGARVTRSAPDSRALLSNATSLFATTVVTSLLGFVFWGAGARLFSTSSLGAGSAAVSAMTLLGTFGMFGVGTVLIGQLGHDRAHAVGTIWAGLALVGVVSAVLGVGGAVLLPLTSAFLRPYADGPVGVVLFAAGVTTTSVSFVLDQAFIGLLHGGLQLWRNLVFSIAKLVLLLAAATVFADRHGVGIYVTWTLGNLVSCAVLGAVLVARGTNLRERPRWATLRALRGPVLTHNWLNGAMQAPRLLLPVVVVALTSPAVNAAFYAAYLIASFLYMVPTHLSTVLYAVGAGDRVRLRHQTRFSLRVSVATGILGCVVIAVGAPYLLGLFGTTYAHRATLALRLLAVCVFPTIVKVHFVAVCRVAGRITRGGLLMTAGGAVELVAAGVGLKLGGLGGLSAGLVVAMTAVATFAMSDIRLVTSYEEQATAEDYWLPSLRPRRQQTARATSDVSAIICAYSDRRWQYLVEAVASLRNQSVAPREIIVVIDNNEDLLERAVSELDGVKVMPNSGDRGAGGARNTGVAAACGGVVAFLDDDATAEDGWIETIERRMATPGLLGVGGRVEARWLEERPGWFPDEFGWVVGCSYRGQPRSPEPVRNLMAGNMAVDRGAFLALGGYRRGHGNVQFDGAGERKPRFVTRQSGCEETDFCIRALARFPGRQWLYDPGMRIRHRVPQERGQWAYFLARCHDEGIAKATVVVEHSGREVGLETERGYVRRTLPAGVMSDCAAVVRGDLWGPVRATAIVAGFAVTAAGYGRGRLQSRLGRLFARAPQLADSHAEAS